MFTVRGANSEIDVAAADKSITEERVVKVEVDG